MKYVLKSTNTERLQNQSDLDPDIITEVFFLCTKSVRDLSEKRTNLQAEIRTKSNAKNSSFYMLKSLNFRDFPCKTKLPVQNHSQIKQK